MSNAGLRAYSLAIVLVVFSVQWQQCVSTAEDFPSDASSVGDDYISYSQQSLSTESPLLGGANNFNDWDNYYQDADVGKENEDDALSAVNVGDEIESLSNGRAVRKSYKNVEDDSNVYDDMAGDIILKGFKWKQNGKKSMQTPSTMGIESTTRAATTVTMTTGLPSTTMLSKSEQGQRFRYDVDESVDDGDNSEEDEFPSAKTSGANGYKDWLTNRKRRAHSSAFEKYKAYHRNYRRNGHKGHKKSFGRYKKYEHHRSKHKSGPHHHHHQQHQHQHHSHYHYPTAVAPVTIPNSYNDKSFYQGQVSYYGQDDEAMDEPGTDRLATDKSIHLPAKMRSYQRYGQYRSTGGGARKSSNTDRSRGVANSYRSDEYPNRSVKWPHLQRIEYQITKDERRERNENDDEDQLPPYIRKYNRRNKQLLDLLEGTIPPSTTTITTSTLAPLAIPAMIQYSTLDSADDGKRTNRKHDRTLHSGGHSHYHNHKNPKWIMEDLFEEQRSNPNNPNIEDDQYLNDSVMPSKAPASVEFKENGDYKNILKAKDFSDEEDDSDENTSKADEDEHLKSIQRNELPSRSILDDSQPPDKKLSSEGKNLFRSAKEFTVSRFKEAVAGNPGAVMMSVSPTETLKISPKANQFIYHRVASSRSVGTGTNIIGVDGGSRKQRLPFVAITDRRLETSKMQKQPADFQQNHMPLP